MSLQTSIHNYFQPAVSNNSHRLSPVQFDEIVSSRNLRSSRTGMKYKSFDTETKLRVSSYAILYGISAALKKYEFSGYGIKRSTLVSWVTAARETKKKSKELVLKDFADRRGKATLLQKYEKEVVAVLKAKQAAGGDINAVVVGGVIKYVLQKKCPAWLICNGGHIDPNASGLYNGVMHRMGYVQRCKVTKHRANAHNFRFVAARFLLRLHLEEQNNDLVPELIVNADETGIRIIPGSKYTMAKKGSKCVKGITFKDKREITAMCAGSKNGTALDLQCIYKGFYTLCIHLLVYH